MWNPNEYIADMQALGFSRPEAVAMARDEATLRKVTARRNQVKQSAREIAEGRPVRFGGFNAS